MVIGARNSIAECRAAAQPRNRDQIKLFLDLLVFISMSVLKILFAAALCVASASVLAATVHSWVDAEGVTHFSDAAPAGAAVNSQTLEINDEFPAPANAESDYYSIANQWSRLRAERDAKTKLALEKSRLRAERKAAQAAATAAQQSYENEPNNRNYYPTFGYNNGFRPHARRGQNLTRDDLNRGPHHVRSNGQHIGGASRARPNRPRRQRSGARFGFNFNFD